MTGPLRSLLTSTLEAVYKWSSFWEDIATFKTVSIRSSMFNNPEHERKCRALSIFIAMYIAVLGVLPVNLSPGLLQAILHGSAALDCSAEAEAWISIWIPTRASVLAHWPRNPMAVVPLNNNNLIALLGSHFNLEVCYTLHI